MMLTIRPGWVNLISHNVEYTVDDLTPTAVIVPTATGHTARMISRFKLPVWIAAVSSAETTCYGLQFLYGCILSTSRSILEIGTHLRSGGCRAKGWQRGGGADRRPLPGKPGSKPSLGNQRFAPGPHVQQCHARVTCKNAEESDSF